jgi:hypothetical protein
LRPSTPTRVVHNLGESAITPAPKSDSSGMTSLTNIVLVVLNWLTVARGRTRAEADAGMSTAEYAVGTVAAVAFAVVLYKIVRSDAVSSALSQIVQSALHAI